eukprot:746060-Hanusia_phi.AAC.2
MEGAQEDDRSDRRGSVQAAGAFAGEVSKARCQGGGVIQGPAIVRRQRFGRDADAGQKSKSRAPGVTRT